MKVSKRIPLIIYSALGLVLLIVLLAGMRELTDGRWGFWGSRENVNMTYNNESESQSNENGDSFNGRSSHALSNGMLTYELDIPFGMVTVQPTDKDAPYVEVTGRKSEYIKVQVQTNESNGTCKLTVKGPKNFWKQFKLLSNEIKIQFYLPEEKLDSLEIECGMGDLTIKDIQADHLDLDLSMGSAEVKDCEFTDIDTDLSMGTMTLYASDEAKKIRVTNDMGETKLYLPKDISGFTLRYEADMGDVDFDDFSALMKGSSNTDIMSKSGDWTYGDNSCTIDLDADMGNIVIKQY